MKRVLWLGSFLDEQTNQIMISQGYKNAASYVSQKNLLEGIEAVTGLVFDSVNAVAMAGYPRQGHMYIQSYVFSHANGAEDTLVGYFNPLYLNKLFMKKAMLKGVKRWLNDRYKDGEDLDVFVYEMRSACLDAVVYIKKNIPNAKIHLIIPDLPCFMDLNMSTLKKTLKQIDWNQMISNFDYITDFIPYTETMVDYLGIRSRKWMVMEGSLNQKEIDQFLSRENVRKSASTSKTIVMYSGWIDQSFGIDALVESMDYLDDTYELWITGGGPYENVLKQRVKGNLKVKYFGFIQTREDLFKLQTQASVMMNIRDTRVDAVHYCFPSKLFEYMLLGIPVISVKLRGIPAEYKNYLYELDEMDGKCIAETIQKVMTDNNRDEKALAGRMFVASEKNNHAIAKKIIDFVKD